MAAKMEKILSECQKNLEKDRAVATGIGMFAVIYNYSGELLLRRRLEKDSLLSQDLSGKWEMIGGGAELPHFTLKIGPDSLSKYQQAIFACLAQELDEEAGLKLLNLPQPLLLIPAWFWKEYKDTKTEEERIVIDLAFSMPIPMHRGYLEETQEFSKKFQRGELMFVPKEELPNIEIISPRTRFLIEQALEHI